MDPLNPGEAQPGASQLNAADPKPNDGIAPSAPTNVDGLSLAELNQLTGRTFTSKESALKSIGDTFKFVTVRKSDIESQVRTEMAQNYEKLANDFAGSQKEMFFLQNPQYAPHRKLIESLGKNPMEVINSDIFKDTYSKLSEHEKTSRLKTVLESNPKLASSRDSMAKAADLATKNNGKSTKEIENLVTQSVKDAFGIE